MPCFGSQKVNTYMSVFKTPMLRTSKRFFTAAMVKCVIVVDDKRVCISLMKGIRTGLERCTCTGILANSEI